MRAVFDHGRSYVVEYMDLGIPLKGTHRAGIKVLKIAHLRGEKCIFRGALN